MKKIIHAILITAGITFIIVKIFRIKRRNTNVTVIKSSDGPTSIFLAGKLKR